VLAFLNASQWRITSQALETLLFEIIIGPVSSKKSEGSHAFNFPFFFDFLQNPPLL